MKRAAAKQAKRELRAWIPAFVVVVLYWVFKALFY